MTASSKGNISLRARSTTTVTKLEITRVRPLIQRRLPATPLLSEAVRVTSVLEQSSFCLGSTLPPNATLKRTEMRNAYHLTCARV
jgi:hypothetical protein